MRKWIARIICALLCLGILLSLIMPAFATETEESTTLTITSAEDFLTFAENCRLDSYSQGLEVQLTADIDLTGTGFTGIPIFCGSFYGNDHTVSGIRLTADGSVQGLFRYLAETAYVERLDVRGEVKPGGSRSTVGGIAGENRGTVRYCTFEGTVSGSETVGGLVGRNTVTGVIESSGVSGTVSGTHFVGGIAGENSGVIRTCKNHANINTTVQENRVSLSDITMDTLINSEAADTTTDIGGISGTSSGVIRDCENHGNVGYKYMGYNIGGIAGSQSGYIMECRNYAQIHGRKEVGGIVGQLEPAVKLAFSADALQILSDQVSGMMGTLNQMSSSAGSLASQFDKMEEQADSMEEALDALKPENGELPDADSILAAQNTLAGLTKDMAETMNQTAQAAEATAQGMRSSIQAMSRQLNAMMGTLNSASENMGGTLTDVSHLDTELDLNAKIEASANYGPVLADYNAGGIAGAVATEADLDTENDLSLTGETSLNFEGEIRAVILNCDNKAVITVSKYNAGGIAGLQFVGLVSDCRNMGRMDCANAEYVGGISGQSTGYIRSSSANCEIFGFTNVGGIAGSADTVTDCHSMVRIYDAAERSGSILGSLLNTSKDLEHPVSGNIYVSIETDIGGIDGISYAGQAEAMTLEDFLLIEEMHDMFRKVTYTFIFEDGEKRNITVPAGSDISSSSIPLIPQKNGATAVWEGLDEADLHNVMHDMTFQLVYTSRNEIIESEQKDESGLPVLLLQGSFPMQTQLSVSAMDESELPEAQAAGWHIHCNVMESVTGARLKMPEDMEPDRIALHLRSSDGSWTEAEFTVDGSYLVFSLNLDTAAVAITETADGTSLPLIGGGVLVVILAAALFLHKNKKKA